jgi:hypothetical protein
MCVFAHTAHKVSMFTTTFNNTTQKCTGEFRRTCEETGDSCVVTVQVTRKPANLNGLSETECDLHKRTCREMLNLLGFCGHYVATSVDECEVLPLSYTWARHESNMIVSVL